MPTRPLRVMLTVPALLLALASSSASRSAAAAPPDVPSPKCVSEHITAELVAETKTVQPGTTFLAGLKFTIDEHWHIYWENPGESGIPTKYVWTLPNPDWRASPIYWPAPLRTETLGSVSYAYEGTFVLPAKITVPKDTPDGKTKLVLKADWLVCYEQCLPCECPAFELEVVVSRVEPEPSEHRPLFEAAKKLWPQPLPAGVAVEIVPVEKALEFRIIGKGPWSPADASLYVFTLVEQLDGGKQADIVDANKPQAVRREGDATTVTLPFPKRRKQPPTRVAGMFVVETAGGRLPFAFDLAVKAAVGGPAAAPVGTPPTGTPPAEKPPAEKPPGGAPPAGVAPGDGASAPDSESAQTESSSGPPFPLPLLLLFAFVGGLILNLMPCVLPVLSIKILGFVSQADEDPARVRRHGYVFAAGVLASFWILAGAILAFKAAGDEVGWGFQLQYAGTNAVLAALMVAVGLNLFGVFEMGTSVMNMAGSAAGKIHSGGYAASFWSGMLATAIATPCSAPFMAPAVGYAVTAPPVESFLLFTLLGAGMAAPYVLLTANPRLLKKVPRPGPWMETFKRILAFPMFVVAAWLVSVVGAQTSVVGMEWMLYGLVVLGIGLWIYGNWGTPERPERTRRIVGYGLSLLVIAGAVALIVVACNEEPKDAGGFVEGDENAPIGAPSGEWEDWSPSLVKRYLKAGYPVFVDYTADWCLSCKAYERVALHTDEFDEAAHKYQVALLKADYTVRTNARGRAIYASLKSFKRAGVPLYVAYSPAPNSEPDVRDALTPDMGVEMIVAAATRDGVPTRTASLPPAPPAPAASPAPGTPPPAPEGKPGAPPPAPEGK